jgi:flavodoxin I
MTAMVVYDSMYGNTQEVAEAIGQALGSQEDVAVVRAGEVQPAQLVGLTLLVVGCPTQKFSPTGAASRFLKSVPPNGLSGVKVAAFDTRFRQSEIDKVRILAFFVRLFGYAAEPMAKRMAKKGGTLAVPPEGFYVGETKGPLLDGELGRAAGWAKQILASL